MIKRESKKSRLDLHPLAAVVLAMVFATSAFATISIPGDTSVGTWDSGTRTYILTSNVSETIQIAEDNLTLDGAGHTANGGGSGHGVFLNGRTGVTIKNLNVEGFNNGMSIQNSSNNTLTNNTTSNNNHGIRLGGSSDNTLTGNIANSNDRYGIHLNRSSGSTLTGNSMSGNRYNFRVEGTEDAHFANSIDTSNTVDGKPVYYVVNDVGGTYDSSTNAGVFYAINCNGITIEDLSPTNNYEGVYLWNTHNSSIENVGASNNGVGIYLRQSSGNSLTGNTTSNNSAGIYLYSSGGSTLTGNSISGNGYNFRVRGAGDFDYQNNIDTSNTVDGKPVYYVVNGVGGIYDSSTNAGVFYAINCDGITIKDLSLTKNWRGVRLWKTHNSSIENVDASNNFDCGIYLTMSTNNTVTGNTFSDSKYGIRLYSCSANTLTGNTVNSSKGYGIYLRDSGNNQVYNNNLIDNDTQARVSGGSGNVFNLAAPTGGNYWSDWTSPDADNDGFVDEPYVFYDGQDNLPWVVQDGWVNQSPVADAGPDQTVIVGQTVTFDASGSYDPDGTIASYDWDFGDASFDSGQITTHEYSSAGIYTVTLTVTDDDGATDTDTAMVTVQTPAEATQDLILYVLILDLPHGIENSLVSKLEAAIKSLDKGRENAAKNQLNAFIKEVEAQRGNKIPEGDADVLIAAAQQIIAALNGP